MTTSTLDRSEVAEERLRDLYAEHGSFLIAHVTRMLRDPQHAEDVVQETLLRAWRHLEKMTENQGSIRGWLMRVAHNIAVDWVRARRARPFEVDPELAPQEPARIEDPCTDLVSLLDVMSLLRSLSPEQGFAIYEIYVNG